MKISDSINLSFLLGCGNIWTCTRKNMFTTEFSLKLDPSQSSLRPWHGHRRRSAAIGAEALEYQIVSTRMLANRVEELARNKLLSVGT